jgi:hypothetical protein
MSARFTFWTPDGVGVWGLFDVEQLIKQAEFGIVPDVIRHGSDLVSQFFEFRNGPSRNPERWSEELGRPLHYPVANAIHLAEKSAFRTIAGYSATCQDDVDRLNERIALLATIDPISHSRQMVKSALTISLYLFSLCL